MVTFLAERSNLFHVIFGLLAILAGLGLLCILAAWRDDRLPDPLPAYLRFLQGEGMPGLARLAGLTAVFGGFVIFLSSILLEFA